MTTHEQPRQRQLRRSSRCFLVGIVCWPLWDWSGSRFADEAKIVDTITPLSSLISLSLIVVSIPEGFFSLFLVCEEKQVVEEEEEIVVVSRSCRKKPWGKSTRFPKIGDNGKIKCTQQTQHWRQQQQQQQQNLVQKKWRISFPLSTPPSPPPHFAMSVCKNNKWMQSRSATIVRQSSHNLGGERGSRVATRLGNNSGGGEMEEEESLLVVVVDVAYWKCGWVVGGSAEKRLLLLLPLWINGILMEGKTPATL